MEKNLRLIVIDELGDSYCFEAFRVPEAETLTRDEVEAFKSVLFPVCLLISLPSRGAGTGSKILTFGVRSRRVLTLSLPATSKSATVTKKKPISCFAMISIRRDGAGNTSPKPNTNFLNRGLKKMNNKIKKYNAVIRIHSCTSQIIKERGFVDIDDAEDE